MPPYVYLGSSLILIHTKILKFFPSSCPTLPLLCHTRPISRHSPSVMPPPSRHSPAPTGESPQKRPPVRTNSCFSPTYPQKRPQMRTESSFSHLYPQNRPILRTPSTKSGHFVYGPHFFLPPSTFRAPFVYAIRRCWAGAAPCYPLRRSSPCPTLSSPKSRDRVGPLVRTSLRSTHRTARDATPVAWCPQALSAALDNPASKLITRGSRRKSHIPAVTAHDEETAAKRQGEMERIVKFWKIFIYI